MNSTHGIPSQSLERHIAILGKTGSGKSNLAKLITEDLLKKQSRVCVIDPTGTWWGVRLKANGKSPSGHSCVIFGGQHGDLSLKSVHGSAIAREIGTTSTPAILDTRQLNVNERTRFFTDFAETLVQSNQGELTLIIDEAHLFMPQSGARVGGGAPAMLHAGNNLVSLGRGVGLRIVLISQRPAKLHKDSLTQVETLVAMRLIAPQDRKAIDEWIGEWADDETGNELKRSLPSLRTGEAWIWSPEIAYLKRIHSPLASTYDSGRVRSAGNPDLPKIDVATIATHLEQDGADVRANDPTVLMRRIAELERELKRKRPAKVVDEAEIERRVKSRLTAERRVHTKNVQRYLDEVEGLARRFVDTVKDARSIFEERIESSPPKDATSIPREETSPAQANGSGDLTGPQRRVLRALGWLEDMGIADSASRTQVAFLAGYKLGGGAFNNTLGSLRSAGLIEYPTSGDVKLTSDGRAQTPSVDKPLTSEALQSAVLERLNGPQRRLLKPVIEAYPEPVDLVSLAQASGYEKGGGAFNNTRGRLRSLGLIDYPAAGFVVAKSLLFVGE